MPISAVPRHNRMMARLTSLGDYATALGLAVDDTFAGGFAFQAPDVSWTHRVFDADGSAHFEVTFLQSFPGLGKWMHVTVEVTFSSLSGHIRVTVDGTTYVDLSCAKPRATTLNAVLLAGVTGSAGPIRVHFDDVRVRLAPSWSCAVCSDLSAFAQRRRARFERASSGSPVPCSTSASARRGSFTACS